MPHRVEAPPTGAPCELRVLTRCQAGASLLAHLGEPLDDHRTRRHVDAERQRLCGEHDLEKAGGEALLHRLPESGDHAGVVRRHAGFEPGDPWSVPEDTKLVVG